MCSGIQGGKTMGGALWMRKRVHEKPQPKTNFLVTAPSHKIMTQATLPSFLKFFGGMGKLNKSEGIFEMPEDRRVYLRTFSDGKNPRAVEGITDLEGNWNDEVGMLNRECAVNLEARTSFRQCPQFNSTTPYAMNWLYKDIYKPFLAGARQDIEFIQFRSVDNPYFPKEEYERQKALLDPRVFSMKYEGQFEKMAGLVYQEWSEVENIIDSFDILRDIKAGQYFVCAGVDWGFTNQFAMSIRAIHKHDAGRDYQIDEFYKTHLTPTEKVYAAKIMKDKWMIESFFCDNESPDMIEEFNRAGLNAVACPKNHKIKVDGIHRHQGLIKQRHHQLFRDKCPNTEEEYAMYHYAEDKGDESSIDEMPVDANNHLMDANRYATQMTEYLRKDTIAAGEFTPAKSYTQKMLDGDFHYEAEPNQDWYE